MTPNCRKAVLRVLGHEGGYANHPNDPGGETMWGITFRTARRHGYTGEMRFLPKETAVEIYEKEYWQAIRGDELPFPLAFQVFDAAVNSGPIQAIKWLQRRLGVTADGIFGPLTLAAVSSIETNPIEFLVTRMEFQTRLPTWATFGKGWALRNIQNAVFALEDTLEESHTV